jgi:hypothetical protein
MITKTQRKIQSYTPTARRGAGGEGMPLAPAQHWHDSTRTLHDIY